MEISKTTISSEASYEIRNLRLKLVNLICSTLIHEPRYYSSSDEGKTAITALVNQVAKSEPEFIFKLALYLRDDLNIRSTSNFILSLAANNKSCHSYFHKYFGIIIRLPSDMLEVVTLYMSLPERYLTGNSIPTVLRKEIKKKFSSFDIYQLAKYNKERSQKRKSKKKDATKEEKPKEEKSKEEKPINLTLKQLIRKVHLAEPAEEVMSIVGKKYPSSEEEFKKTGLSGNFDPQRIGRRMKLPTPETWETLLSAKGNKHTTWEELLDHKKLPIMAMIRNLRNMIITGISPEHHNIVLNRLTDEKTIINSRQFPWRFLSAYQAINIDLENLMNDILDNEGSCEKIIEVKVKGKKGKQMGKTRKIRKRVIIPVNVPDNPLIQKYQQAIDTAIRISTLHNIKPIEGSTVVFCDVSGSMKCPCSSRGNMGSLQSVLDIGILLGLMLQDVCDQCDFRIFSSPITGTRCDLQIPLKSNSILNNIKRVNEYISKLGGGTDFPYDYLQDLIDKKIKIDNFIILSDMMIAPGRNEMNLRGYSVTNILQKYRSNVNPDLLFVSIDLYGGGKSIVDINEGANPKDVMITGFSDNILRFISERGNYKQLEYIEGIYESKILKEKKI